MDNLRIAREGMRMFVRSLRVRLFGFRRLGGTADEICRESIKRCWNGRFLMVSSGHFSVFYTRDFGFCVDSLLKLGYREKVLKTLDYALGVFSKHNRTSTSINPSGKPFDFPRYSVDTLPYLVRSLRVAKADSLAAKHEGFLTKEIERFEEKVFDEGMVRRDAVFSSMKDHSMRESSCYDNCMLGMLARELDNLDLENPFKGNYERMIKKNFWQGKYFYDDLRRKDYVAGDANIFPFWTGIIKDKKMLRLCIDSIKREGLDSPFPLKYTASGDHKLIRLAGDYERDAIWMHMGPLYLQLVKKVDRKLFQKYLADYKSVIEKHGTFLEVFDKNGRPFRLPYYYTDEGMLWAANYLTL